MQMTAALLSAAAMTHYLDAVDPEFQGWGDVFYFCGSRFQFCRCDLHWNNLGALHAPALAHFLCACIGTCLSVLSAPFLSLLLPLLYT